MAGTNFTIGVNESEFTRKWERIISQVESLGTVSKTVGKELYQALGKIKDTSTLQKAFDALNDSVKENDRSIANLCKDLKELNSLEKQASENGSAKQVNIYKAQAKAVQEQIALRRALGQSFDEVGQKLNEEKKKLEENENKQLTFRTQLRETREEYMRMKQAKDQGLEVDEAKFAALEKKFTELQHVAWETSQTMGKLSTPGTGIAGVVQGVGALTGAFSAAQGVMGLFNAKSEETQKIMLKVQSLMSITMGIQQIQNALLSTSALRIGVVNKLKEWWVGVTKKAAAAQTAENAAAKAGAGAFKTLGVAIKSIPGVGWLIAGLTALVGVLRKVTQASREAKKAEEELFNATAADAAKPIAKIKELSYAYKQLQDDAQRKEFLKEHKKDFDELGVAINSVADAENALVKNTDAWIQAEKYKAAATAARNIMVASMETLLKAERTAEEKSIKNLSSYENLSGNPIVDAIRGIFGTTARWSANKTINKETEYQDVLSRGILGLDKLYEDAMKKAGIKTLTPGGDTTKLPKDSRKSAAEIAKDYNEFLQKVNEEVRKSALEREKGLRKTAAESITNELERELKEIENEAWEAGMAAEEWRNKMLKEGQAKIRQLYKDTYGADAPENWNENSKQWTEFKKNYWNPIERAINDEADEKQAAIEEKRQKDGEAARKRQAEAEEDAMNEYLAKYGEYWQAKLAIAEIYAKKIAKATTEGEKKILEQERDSELFDLELKHNKDTAELFASVTNRSKASLEAQLTKLKERLKLFKDEKKSLKEIQAIQEKINEIEDAIFDKEENEDIFNFQGVIKQLGEIERLRQREIRLREEADEAEAKGDKEKAERLRKQADELRMRIVEMFQNLKKNYWKVAIDILVNGFQEAAKFAKQLSEITGDSKMGDWAEQANALAQNLSAAWQGYQATGNWVGAVAGGVSDILAQSIQAGQEQRLWVAEFNRSIKNFRSAIELAAVTFDPKKFETIFGTKSLESATEAYTKMNEAQSAYYEKVTKPFRLGGREKENANLGDAIFQGSSFVGSVTGLAPLTGLLRSFSGFRSKTSQRWYSELDAYQRGLNQLQAMQVETKHRNGWARFWGYKSQYKSLYDVAPELWDENGEFNVENAQKFLEASKQLTAKQRDQIQNAIDLKKAYDEAREALEEIVSETVGTFGDDLADAVWEAITTGADAWKIFEEKGNEAIASLVKQMIKEFAITNYLDQFTEKLKKAYGSGDQAQIAAIYGEIFEGLPTFMETLTQQGLMLVEKFKAQGIDLTAKGATGGTVGGYTTQMSHEDASEINGRMTDIQMQIRLIQGNVMQIVTIQQEVRGFARMQTDYLYDIRRYTAALPTIQEYAKKIATNTANL